MSVLTKHNQTIQHLAQQLRRWERTLGRSREEGELRSTGIAPLDDLLPDGGLHPGSLVECLSRNSGSGAETLAQKPLKEAYSDHRPLWMRFATNAGQKDSGTAVTSQTYVATQSGKKFHLPSCRTIQGRSTPKTFNTRAAALSELAPCLVCKP